MNEEFDIRESLENNPGYKNRDSKGYAGFVGSIHKAIRPMIESFENIRFGSAILFILAGFLGAVQLVVVQYIQSKQLAEVSKTYGFQMPQASAVGNWVIVPILIAILSYLIYNFIFLFTRKNMSPIDKKRKNVRNGIFVVLLYAIQIPIQLIPLVSITWILGIIVQAIIYAVAFYDYVEDDEMVPVSIKAILVQFIAALILVIALIAFFVIMISVFA